MWKILAIAAVVILTVIGVNSFLARRDIERYLGGPAAGIQVSFSSADQTLCTSAANKLVVANGAPQSFRGFSIRRARITIGLLLGSPHLCKAAADLRRRA